MIAIGAEPEEGAFQHVRWCGAISIAGRAYHFHGLGVSSTAEVIIGFGAVLPPGVFDAKAALHPAPPRHLLAVRLGHSLGGGSWPRAKTLHVVKKSWVPVCVGLGRALGR